MSRNKNTIHLGTLKGKVLLFGGIYSNYPALGALLLEADKQGIPSSNIISTGDIVGYCAQPNECLEALQNRGIKSIAGNVEIQLREGLDDCGCDFDSGSRCDVFSKNWYAYASSELNDSSLPWLNDLPDFLEFQFANKKVSVVHGSFHHTSEFVFKSTSWEVKDQNFKDLNTDVIVAGHCGLPFLDQKENNIWLNPGVIGMPANDGRSEVWYAVLEEIDNELVINHHQLVYDHQFTANLMREKKLPLSYAETLATGIWDNCDILPEIETAAQGQTIDL